MEPSYHYDRPAKGLERPRHQRKPARSHCYATARPTRCQASLVGRSTQPTLKKCAYVVQRQGLVSSWPSREPIGERGGFNLYGFVGNDGFGRRDYLGLVVIFPPDFGDENPSGIPTNNTGKPIFPYVPNPENPEDEPSEGIGWSECSWEASVIVICDCLPNYYGKCPDPIKPPGTYITGTDRASNLVDARSGATEDWAGKAAKYAIEYCGENCKAQWESFDQKETICNPVAF